MESLLEMRPFVLAFSTSFCWIADRTQLVAGFPDFPLAIMFLDIRCFTRIYKSAPGGYARGEKDAEIGNGGGREEELVKSKKPHSPLIYLLGEGTWAETW
jgi:hypothetical protein